MNYFAYGSNMSRARLEERVGPCRVLGAARLDGWGLAFHKRGRDGSGKCDVARAPGTCVHGVVYALDARAKRALDGFEGPGYETRAIEVLAGTGDTVRAVTYVARAAAIEAGLVPFTWYKRLVVEGAREHRLPPDYVAGIEALAAREDPDRERAARHLRLVGPDPG